MRIRGAVLLALSALAFAACGGPEAPKATDDVVTIEKFEVGHVHGLGLVEDTLLIGTHEGVYAQTGKGQPVLMGEKFDVMGMFADRGVLYASGHPDEKASDKRDLGLRVSNDGGKSWQQLSLLGEADFHRLVVVGSIVMGVNSLDGQVMRSEDGGKTWKRLGQIGAFDLAINPEMTNVVLATTEKGLMTSTDSGRTWGAPASQPLLMFVAFTSGGLIGIAPDGQVYRQGEDGWAKRGAVFGQPEAVATDGNRIVVAVGGKVLESSDFGQTFTVRVTGLPGH